MTISRTELFIAGAWREGTGGRRFPVVNPADEEILANVADGTVDDALAAMDAAAAALPAWSATAPRARAEILRKCFELITARGEFLSRLITLENGKPLADSRAEVAYAAEFFRWYSEEAVRVIGQVSRAPSSGARILVQYRPAGVAVLVTPWNYPAAMGTRKIAPALAAGCTMVLKPAEETPLTMLALAEIFTEAGVPSGAVNILPTSDAPGTVAAMLHHPSARVVSFTGSTEVGRHLLKLAADRVLNPRMELGGNAPFIVFDDADLEAAVSGAMIAKMRNLGEACTAANRFFVQDGIHDRFVDALAQQMGVLKMGSGLDETVRVGPLVNASARDKVDNLVQDARGRGARAVLGGQRPNGKGYFYPATVLADVAEGAECFKTEIFGPVAAVRRFACADDAVAWANDTDHGLSAYIYTRDVARGLRVCEGLEFGMVGLNRGLVSDPAAPFGGMKQSGLGREGAHEGILEFLEAQYISTEW